MLDPQPTPAPPQPHGSDFAQVVADSKADIAHAELPPIKHSRGGRRPGSGRKRVSGDPASPSPQSIAGTPPGAPDISKDLIAPLIAISTMPARALNVPELALSKDEAHACAVSLNNILVAFAPAGQINPKTAAILGAAVTFGSIGFTKYAIYVEKCQPPPAPHPMEDAKPGEEPPKEPIPVVRANDYFKQRNRPPPKSQ